MSAPTGKQSAVVGYAVAGQSIVGTMAPSPNNITATGTLTKLSSAGVLTKISG